MPESESGRTTIYLLTQPNERLAFYTTFDKDEAKARAAETGEVLLCFDVYRAADSSLNTSNILPSWGERSWRR